MPLFLRHVAVALVLVTAVGCSSDGAGTATAPTSKTSGRTFASTTEVIAAMERAGLRCEQPEQGVVEGVAEAQRCIVGGAEDAIVLRFADGAQRDGYLAGKDELASAVVGPNWAVQTVLPQTAEQVRDAIGGELVLGQGGDQQSG